MTDVTDRFTALVQGAPDRIALDEAALLIAAHAHADLDVAARLAHLDELAAQVRVADAPGVAAALFGDGGFTGNTVDYYDPSNSYLDDVLDRRLGIPITLSVLMIEVGRRAGVPLAGVGMPGHFLVGSDGIEQWFDPFHGPEPLGVDECEALYARQLGAVALAQPLQREQLAAVGPLAILDRMLANLQQTLLQRDPAAAAWPTRLRLAFPSLPPHVRAQLAATLGSLGQFGEAAAQLDAVAAELGPDAPSSITRAAARLRARAN